jgi:hypothetical protein
MAMVGLIVGLTVIGEIGLTIGGLTIVVFIKLRLRAIIARGITVATPITISNRYIIVMIIITAIIKIVSIVTAIIFVDFVLVRGAVLTQRVRSA